MLNREKSAPKGSEIVGLLDIGTSKVVCIIAALEPSPVPGEPRVTRLLGLGHLRSRGLKSGVIIDLAEAEATVRAAIAQAERMARVTLEEVLVSVSCGRLQSSNFSASVDVPGGVIRTDDIDRLMAGGHAFAERDGRTLIHLNRIGYRIDGVAGASDPRGLAASKLAADLHTVAADEAPVRNLMLVVERCYLNVRALIATPYASALSATTEEERALGVTCIDIGGGTATVASFADGHFIHAATVPLGGHHITLDIAQSLQTPLAEAERIKTLYGSLVVAQSDEFETFSFPLAGDEDGALGQATKAELAGIIRPRVSNILGLVRERLEKAGVLDFAGERVVLTGGASALVGFGEFAANALGRPARVATPQPIAGMPQGSASPAFSTVAGLLAVAASGSGEVPVRRSREALGGGYLERVGEWLKAGFA
ncbi:Cell division protein FtsA [Hyphomicrobium sulfonivorans]|uniref:Cell division protein FtsA n=1 Tax=Hyphomicrobium sulfonivorans TaxID=121290 RepID=A0A120CT86_HYPSL|nr:cell division protein FtsA [Hyphomicrobium sulfonivorans]KWT64288.1 Cell division protein FtsA [Hyphomicrobium sulfonivorans]